MFIEKAASDNEVAFFMVFGPRFLTRLTHLQEYSLKSDASNLVAFDYAQSTRLYYQIVRIFA